VLTKLLTLLSTAKGAAAAGVLAAASVGTGVAATNSDVQNAIGTAVQNVTEAVTNVVTQQPPVVTARNGADKKLRDAYQNDQQTLEKLHSTKVASADRSKLDELLGAADAKLRDRLTLALNDVAALTLGREGLEASGASKPSPSPDVKASFTADAQAKVDATAASAIADMDTIVTDATAAVGALPTFTPGKPADVPGGKPNDIPGGKPADVPGGAPATRPTR
jgi:hypothetical protein